MSLRFARNAALLLTAVASTLSAAALSDGLQKGQNYYFAADFKKAISQFELTIRKNPSDPEPYLWLGKSYALLAETKPPVLGALARSKARRYLVTAVHLAPDCTECRRELFDLLVESDTSASASREAKALLENVRESDAEYPSMRSLLAQRRSQQRSPEYLTTVFFSFPSQAVAQLTVRPAPGLPERR